jgi:hypothetical protein
VAENIAEAYRQCIPPFSHYKVIQQYTLQDIALISDPIYSAMTPNCRTYAGICPRWQSIPSNSQNLARDTGRKYSEPICNPQPSPQSPSLNSQPVIPTSSSQHNSPPKSLFPAVPQAAMPAPDVVYTADESSSITLQTGSSVDNTTKNDIRYGRRICYPALASRTHSHINR